MKGQILRFNECSYDCYRKPVGRGFRVYCRKVDKACKPGLKPYWQMSVGEFINNYELQVGDPIVTHAYWYATDKDPHLPKSIDSHDIVKSRIVGFSKAILRQGAPLVKFQAERILAHNNVPVDPQSEFADKLKGRIGTAPIDEVSYGEVHKEFIRQALREGKPVPKEVLKHYQLG